jgi:chorismate-pyruvate lyase
LNCDQHPDWQKAPSPGLPERYRHWLTEVKRLSHTMNHAGDVNLTIIKMQTESPLLHEACHFSPTPMFIREITLSIDENTFSHGRLCFPDQTWRAIGNDILALGTRPIGETLLHHAPSIHRSEFMYRPATPQEYRILNNQPIHFEPWLRCSCFSVDNTLPLLLTELLSPRLDKL